MASPLDGVKLSLVTCIDDICDLKRWMGERRAGILSFDTESAGLSPEKDALRLIQLGDEKRGWAIPAWGWGGAAMELLHAYEGPLAAHNRAYDLRVLMRQAGFRPKWERINDTLTMAHLLDPLRPRGLKSLADRLVDKNASSGERVLKDAMRKNGWDWGTVPLNYPGYYAYSALDPVLTSHIYAKLQPDMNARGYAGIYDFELGVSKCCTEMMQRGIAVDVEYITAKMDAIADFTGATREWLAREHSITSPMSARQVAAAMEAHGQQVIFETATGLPEMTKETLNWYAQNAVNGAVAELVQYLLRLRHLEKMADSYLSNILSLRDGDDIIHPNIWPLAARTSRMSITDPALQTLPAEDKLVRGAFVPRPGMVFISIDASQIEMRLAASFSGDTGLIEAFRQADEPGAPDFFSVVASELWRQQIERSDRRRQMVKNMSYARLFGGGLERMAITAGVTVQQMGPIRDMFDHRFPGLTAWSDRVIEEARERTALTGRPHALTPMGRYLPVEAGKIYPAVNYTIQATAAEVLKRGILELDAAGFGSLMLLPVHDELIFECPAEDAETVLLDCVKILDGCSGFAVPVPWDGKIMAERWNKG